MSNCFIERENSVNFSQTILAILISIFPSFGGCGGDDDEPFHANADGFVLKVSSC